MNHRPSSVYSQQITYRHMGHRLRFAICEGTTGHDQRGRIVCDGNGQSFITVHRYCQGWVRFQAKLLSFCYNHIGKFRALLILFMTHKWQKCPSRDAWSIINTWKWLNFISVNIFVTPVFKWSWNEKPVCVRNKKKVYKKWRICQMKIQNLIKDSWVIV